jgi:hypothetical protein
MKNKAFKIAVYGLIAFVSVAAVGLLIRSSPCLLDGNQQSCEISPIDPPLSIRIYKWQ